MWGDVKQTCGDVTDELNTKDKNTYKERATIRMARLIYPDECHKTLMWEHFSSTIIKRLLLNETPSATSNNKVYKRILPKMYSNGCEQKKA